VISTRALVLLRRVGIEEFVITGGIAENVGVVTKLRAKLGRIEVRMPAEPMIAGALGAALFAHDRAQDKAQPDVAGNALVRSGAPH
jgi:activator of 2-hydroxyglutaryl-CoA dehydratase